MNIYPIRLAGVFMVVLACMGLAGRSAGAAVAPTVLLPSDAVGGRIVTMEGRQGIIVPAGTPTDQGYMWKLAKPLSSGWWEVVLEFIPRPGDSQRFQLFLGTRLQGGLDLSDLDIGGQSSFRFRFWNASAVESMAVRPRYKLSEDLRAVGRATISPVAGPGGDASQPLVVELPLDAAGGARLPDGLTAGNWQLTPRMSQGQGSPSGEVTVAVAGGGRLTMPQAGAMYFAVGGAIQSIHWRPAAGMDGAVLGFLPAAKPRIPLDGGGAILPVAAEGAHTRVTLTFTGVRGGRPGLPVLPGGARMAVVTSWDDGVAQDLRTAELLEKNGMKGTFFAAQNAYAKTDFLAELERRGMEVGSHTINHPRGWLISPERWAAECLQMRVRLESVVRHPVVSFAYPYNHTRADDAAGDYVLRGVREAGYLSARTTRVGVETIAGCAEPLLLRTDGHFKQHRANFEKAWARVAQGEPGGIFYFWGHSYEMKAEQDWADLGALLERYAHRPEAWYATQGQVFLWRWLRERAQWENPQERAGALRITLSYPKLDPWWQRQLPVTVAVPEGATGAVLGDGRALKIERGLVTLPNDVP